MLSRRGHEDTAQFRKLNLRILGWRLLESSLVAVTPAYDAQLWPTAASSLEISAHTLLWFGSGELQAGLEFGVREDWDFVYVRLCSWAT